MVPTDQRVGVARAPGRNLKPDVRVLRRMAMFSGLRCGVENDLLNCTPTAPTPFLEIGVNGTPSP